MYKESLHPYILVRVLHLDMLHITFVLKFEYTAIFAVRVLHLDMLYITFVLKFEYTSIFSIGLFVRLVVRGSPTSEIK